MSKSKKSQPQAEKPGAAQVLRQLHVWLADREAHLLKQLRQGGRQQGSPDRPAVLLDYQARYDEIASLNEWLADVEKGEKDWNEVGDFHKGDEGLDE